MKGYYITTKKGSFGSFLTFQEAQKTAELLNLNLYKIKIIKVTECPFCYKIDKLTTIQELGFCSWCEEHLY